MNISKSIIAVIAIVAVVSTIVSTATVLIYQTPSQGVERRIVRKGVSQESVSSQEGGVGTAKSFAVWQYWFLLDNEEWIVVSSSDYQKYKEGDWITVSPSLARGYLHLTK